MLHAFQQRADAAAAVIRDRSMVLDHEHELLVLGAEAELRLGLAARFEPRDKLLARLDRRHVDLVTSHAGIRQERAATLHGSCAGGQLVKCRVWPLTRHFDPRFRQHQRWRFWRQTTFGYRWSSAIGDGARR